MVQKICELPLATREVLQKAAGVGNSFTLEAVSEVVLSAAGGVGGDLWQAVKAGLLLPGSDECQLFDGDAAAELGDDVSRLLRRSVTFRFAHDRVQQAAWSLLEDDAQKKTKLRYGHYLLASTPASERDKIVILVAEALNQARELLTDPAELARLAELNLSAATKAVNSASYADALVFLHHGLACLGAQAANVDEALPFEMELLTAECEFLDGQHDNAGKRSAALLKATNDRDKKTAVLMMQMALLTNSYRHHEAVSKALDAFCLQGVRLPRNPGPLAVLPYVVRFKMALRGVDTDTLLTAGWSVSQKVRKLGSITSAVMDAAYLANQNLFAIVVLHMATTILRHGHVQDSAYILMAFSVLLSHGLKDFATGKVFADLGLALTDQYDAPRMRARVVYAYAGFQGHWYGPAQNNFPYLRDALTQALSGGDFNYANYSLGITLTTRLLLAGDLDECLAETERFADLVDDPRVSNGAAWVVLTARTCHALQGELDDPINFSDDDAQKHDLVTHYLDSQATGRFLFGVMQMLSHYLAGRSSSAHAVALETDPATALGQLYVPYFYFLDALIAIRAMPTQGAMARLRSRVRVLGAKRKLRAWAERVPENYAHLHALVVAEATGASDRRGGAMPLYEEACKLARNARSVWVTGCAYEAAGRHLLRCSDPMAAWPFFENAFTAFQSWGAQVKLADLDRLFTGLKAEGGALAQVVDAWHARRSEGQEGARAQGDSDLDWSSLMKSSLAITGEMEMAQLLERFGAIILENVAAERMVLALMDETLGALQIEAQSSLDMNTNSVSSTVAPCPLDEDAPGCAAMMQYVARTMDELVLADALSDPSWKQEPAVQRGAIRAVLVVPIVDKGNLKGVIYVENKKVRGAFNPKRVEVVRVLAAQAAIAFENARLVASLQQRMDEERQLKVAFRRFVPESFLRLLKKDSVVDVGLGDCVQLEMTVLFSDVRSFTSILETMTPQQSFAFINAYLGRMEPVINEAGGFIDKYIGDAIMALFESSADDALRAGLMMLAALGTLNDERAAIGAPNIHIGIGLNTGHLMLGTVGGEGRLEGTVISDAVNLASRVEGLSKHYDAPLLISEHTYQALEHPEQFATRYIDKVKVKGKEEEVGIVEVLDGDPAARRELKMQTREAFAHGVEAFFQGRYEHAVTHLEGCLAVCDDDTPCRLLLARARAAAQELA